MTAPPFLRYSGRCSFRLMVVAATLVLAQLHLCEWAACAQSGPPGLISEPLDRTSYVGTAAELRVIATGAAPLAYQWLFEGTNRLAGATSAVLTLPSVRLTNAGNYYVEISNSLGVITSDPGRLT